MNVIRKISDALRFVFVIPLKIYQKLISPLFPARCKYYPTCSNYAVDAYKKHGIIMGTVLTAWRLLRCNPWSFGGVDYVPDKISIDYFKPKNLKKKK